MRTDGRTDSRENAIVAPRNFASVTAFQPHGGGSNKPDIFLSFRIILQIV